MFSEMTYHNNTLLLKGQKTLNKDVRAISRSLFE